MMKNHTPGRQQLDRLKELCCKCIVQHGAGATQGDQQMTESASQVLNCSCKMIHMPVQVGRGLPSSDNSDSDEETGSEDDSEGSSSGETERDHQIKEVMADVMYICCQRPDKRREMLEQADKHLVKSICECAKSILSGAVPINYSEKDKLAEYKDVLRQLSDDKKGTQHKKDIIVQNGGNFLLSLIPTIIGAMSAMFS